MRTVTPSSAEDDDARAPAAGGRATALLRGSLMHRLLQSLPDIPAEQTVARRRKIISPELAQELAQE